MREPKIRFARNPRYRARARQARWRAAAWIRQGTLRSRLLTGARRLLGDARDAVDSARGRTRPWYLPPRRERFVCSGSYCAVGENMVRLLERHAGLSSESDVLDIGCGTGRVAVALFDRLGPEARYEGFDVVPDAIRWCRDEISTRNPNFSFKRIDVRNRRYNRDGGVPAGDIRLPYPDGAFDVALAASVFTHMRADEIERYLTEVRRLLRPDARLLSTWYLLDETRPRAGGPEGDPERWFPGVLGGGERVVSTRLPEYAIAFQRAEVERMHLRAGLGISAVATGSWLGVPASSFQDLVIAGPN